MEDAQAIFGRIEVGMIQPVLPKSTSFKDLLIEIRADLVKTKDTLTEKMYTGIINVIDDFFHTVNKNIYLIDIINKERDWKLSGGLGLPIISFVFLINDETNKNNRRMLWRKIL